MLDEQPLAAKALFAELDCDMSGGVTLTEWLQWFAHLHSRDPVSADSKLDWIEERLAAAQPSPQRPQPQTPICAAPLQPPPPPGAVAAAAAVGDAPLAEHAAALAFVLYRCMKGLAADTDNVYAAAHQITSQGMWDEVQAQFRARHRDLCGGDLRRALASELASEEERGVRDALEGAGVAWDRAPPSPRAAVAQ